MAETNTRHEILEAADDLFYRAGYEATSFADIAGAVGISRGNFYYHFKTKDDILKAVIDLRMTRTRDMLAAWENAGDTPEERIGCFIKILIANQTKIMAHGCPVGTLATELAKLNHPAQADANQLFTLFHDWLAEQFERLGRKSDADELAMHLLARSQGAATMMNAFQDRSFMQREVDSMIEWVALQRNSTNSNQPN